MVHDIPISTCHAFREAEAPVAHGRARRVRRPATGRRTSWPSLSYSDIGMCQAGIAETTACSMPPAGRRGGLPLRANAITNDDAARVGSAGRESWRTGRSGSIPKDYSRARTVMEAWEAGRATEAAVSTSSALGLQVEDAVVVHNSDRIAVHLVPCDVLARGGPSVHQADAQFELEVARRLALTDGPVGELEPRVEPRAYIRDPFVITLWTYYESVESDIGSADYADALGRLHAGLRQ